MQNLILGVTVSLYLGGTAACLSGCLEDAHWREGGILHGTSCQACYYVREGFISFQDRKSCHIVA